MSDPSIENSEEYIEVFNIVNYNILIIGDSRSGKSTFINLIKDINHTVESEVFRGTKDPKSETILTRYKSKFMNLNIIDTPGFNEVSNETNRPDTNLKTLITSFVKKDVTRLHLIMIAINGSSGLNQNQVQSIRNAIKFLGKNLSKNTCLLVTHFDTKDENEEKDWINKFQSNKNMEFISKVCKAGFLFTGGIDKSTQKNVKMRDMFIHIQNKRILKFMELLNSLEPELLNNDFNKMVNSMFHISESIIKDYMLLKELSPEIKDLVNNITRKRAKLNKLIDSNDDYNKKYEDLIEKAGKVGTEEFSIPNYDDKIEDDIKRYREISESIKQNTQLCSKKYDELSDILNEISSALDIVEFEL